MKDGLTYIICDGEAGRTNRYAERDAEGHERRHQDQLHLGNYTPDDFQASDELTWNSDHPVCRLEGPHYADPLKQKLLSFTLYLPYQVSNIPLDSEKIEVGYK